VTMILLGGGSQIGLGVAFLAAAALVIVAGMNLSRYGNALGERTGLGSGLVGLLVIAGITSLPELVVSGTSAFSAAAKAAELPLGAARDALLAGGADLALGNMLGSNVFNLMLVAVMDSVYRAGALTPRLSQRHALPASGGMVMLGIVLFGLALERHNPTLIPGLGCGVITPILLVCYVGIMVLQNRLEQRDAGAEGDAGDKQDTGDGRRLLQMPAWCFYGALVFLAAVIVLSGVWLSILGDRMSLPSSEGGFGLGQSFVGTFFLAISTSLPELVICISSVRLGFLDMAVGNVFGSNMFNLVIVLTADIALRDGAILHCAGVSHLVTIAMVMVLTGITMISLTYRSERHFAKLGLDAWLMIVVYVIGNAMVFSMAK
jgi:cation:H+ antiporter